MSLVIQSLLEDGCLRHPLPFLHSGAIKWLGGFEVIVMLMREDVNLLIGERVLSITLPDLASTRNWETSKLKFHLLFIEISFKHLRMTVM